MTDKAYIVANEEQEREVLEKLEREDLVWVAGGEKPTKFTPKSAVFPYVLFIDNKGRISWGNIGKLTDKEIVYDGRKEERVSDKYVVSQEFMDELKEWKNDLKVNGRYYIYEDDIYDLPSVIENWWKHSRGYDKEANNRLITIIRWVDGEDVFEVEKPKKWVVRSKERDGEGDYGYIFINPYNLTLSTYSISQATRFDTKEEAQEWANSHQEVVEVVDV